MRRGRAIVDGAHLYWEARGRGPVVLLVHGGAEDSFYWRAEADAVARSGRCAVTYDRRGTGRSGRSGWPGAGADGHGDDAAALIAQLDVEQVDVIGGSSGAQVALALAVRHPGRVRSAVFYEPAALGSTELGRAALVQMRESATEHVRRRPGDWAGAYAAWVEQSEPGRWDALPAWRQAREPLNAEPFFRDDLALLVDYQPPGALEVAATVICGTQTLGVMPAAAQAVAARIGVQLRFADGAGHNPYVDRPGYLTSALAELAEAT